MDCNVLLKFIFWVAGQPTIKGTALLEILTPTQEKLGNDMGTIVTAKGSDVLMVERETVSTSYMADIKAITV